MFNSSTRAKPENFSVDQIRNLTFANSINELSFPSQRTNLSPDASQKATPNLMLMLVTSTKNNISTLSSKPILTRLSGQYL